VLASLLHLLSTRSHPRLSEDRLNNPQEYSSSMDHGYILMYERQRPGERADADADPFGGPDDEAGAGTPQPGWTA